ALQPAVAAAPSDQGMEIVVSQYLVITVPLAQIHAAPMPLQQALQGLDLAVGHIDGRKTGSHAFKRFAHNVKLGNSRLGKAYDPRTYVRGARDEVQPLKPLHGFTQHPSTDAELPGQSRFQNAFARHDF